MFYYNGENFALATASMLTIFTSLTAATPGLLSLPLERRSVPQNLHKRDLQTITATNYQVLNLYSANVSIGTPPQTVQLQIDTGSSDLWAFGPNSCDIKTAACKGGSVDPSKSSSESPVEHGPVTLKYGGSGTSVTGNYHNDIVSVGGFKVKGQTYIVSTQAEHENTGILGLGYDTLEFSFSSGQDYRPYNSFLDNMVDEKIIPSKAFSLWLSAEESNSGEVLFGGYDSEKYVGELIVMNTQANPGTQGVLNQYLVPWTGLSVSDADGTILLTDSNFAVAALLDSGTSGIQLPQALVTALVQLFDLPDPGKAGHLDFPCSARAFSGTIDFAFGGPDGGVVQVPIQELLQPAFDSNGNPQQYDDGENLCTLFISAASGTVILGDAFLRSAYVVFDQENDQIGIANTNFDAKDSKASPIPSGGLAAIPSAIVATSLNLNPTVSPKIQAIAQSIPLPSDFQTSFAGLPQVTDGASATAAAETKLSAVTGVSFTPVVPNGPPPAATSIDAKVSATGNLPAAGTAAASAAASTSKAAAPRSASVSASLDMALLLASAAAVGLSSVGGMAFMFL